MEQIENDVEQLDRYLLASCSEEENREIETKLVSDMEFLDLLEDMHIMREALIT